MKQTAIGIFDSGLGGLTAMKALQELLPEENIIYFGDTGRLPYGAKSQNQLRHMAVQDLELIASFGVKAIVVACGTLSSTAPDILEKFPVPTFGVLKASVRAMEHVPGSSPLAVIATEASIRSGAYQRALTAACPGREILAVACPDFVPLIESGHCDAEDPLVQEAVARYLAPIRKARPAALLLGCTHYGIIGEAIQACVGPDTQLIEASVCAAAQVSQYLIVNGLTGGEGGERLYASGSAEHFAAAASTFLGRALTAPVTQLPVMEVQKC